MRRHMQHTHVVSAECPVVHVPLQAVIPVSYSVVSLACLNSNILRGTDFQHLP